MRDFMIDNHSYTHNLISCEIKAWKTQKNKKTKQNKKQENQSWTGFDTGALPTELSSHLGAGHFVSS